MRAEIEIKENTDTYKLGLFKKHHHRTWRVFTNLSFSPEEIKIIEDNNLWERAAFTRAHSAAFFAGLPPDAQAALGEPMEVPITLRRLAEPGFFVGCGDVVEAKEMVQEFEEEILPRIKNFLNSVNEKPTGKRVVDF